MTFNEWLHSIVNLFYPRVCAACGEPLLKDEVTVCMPLSSTQDRL